MKTFKTPEDLYIALNNDKSEGRTYKVLSETFGIKESTIYGILTKGFLPSKKTLRVASVNRSLSDLDGRILELEADRRQREANSFNRRLNNFKLWLQGK